MITNDRNTSRGSTKGTIRRAQTGEKSAFHHIYVSYHALVYRSALRIVRDPHEAEDVSQQVFTKLMTTIGQYEPRDQHFSHWLTRVSRNAALDHVRRKRPIPLDEAEEMADSKPARTPDVLEDLKSALGSLPGEQCQIVLMRHLIGLSPDEIAERTGRTTASVNGLHFRARRELRSQLRSMGRAPTTCVA